MNWNRECSTTVDGQKKPRKVFLNISTTFWRTSKIFGMERGDTCTFCWENFWRARTPNPSFLGNLARAKFQKWPKMGVWRQKTKNDKLNPKMTNPTFVNRVKFRDNFIVPKGFFFLTPQKKFIYDQNFFVFAKNR